MMRMKKVFLTVFVVLASVSVSFASGNEKLTQLCEFDSQKPL